MAIIPAIWRRISGAKNTSHVNVVAERFVQVFIAHGVQVSQIPRLLPTIRLESLQSPEKLLAVLTPDLLDQVARLFGIRVEWLEAVDDEIYAPLCCYKSPELFLNKFSELYLNPNNDRWFPVQVLCTDRHLDKNNNSLQQLAPVMVEQVAVIGEEQIYRYHIFRDGYDWSHKPCRIELKALIRLICNRFCLAAPLFQISPVEMEKVLNGELVPRKFLLSGLASSPSLEDYAQTDAENLVAQETEEIPEVLGYIETHKLADYLFQKPLPQSSDDIGSSAIKPSSTRQNGEKRKNAQEEIWDPARTVAKALWAEDVQLTKTEVAERIKGMRHLKASAFEVNTIHKRIRDLAPPGSEKPGRRSNKSD